MRQTNRSGGLIRIPLTLRYAYGRELPQRKKNDRGADGMTPKKSTHRSRGLGYDFLLRSMYGWVYGWASRQTGKKKKNHDTCDAECILIVVYFRGHENKLPRDAPSRPTFTICMRTTDQALTKQSICHTVAPFPPTLFP